MFLCGVYDNESPKLYIDGVQQTNGANNQDIVYAGGVGQAVWIGGIEDALTGNPYDSYFNGLINNVSIYDRALSPTEIAQLYREPYGMFL